VCKSGITHIIIFLFYEISRKFKFYIRNRLLNNNVALPKVNTKDLIKQKLPKNLSTTLKVPEPVPELKNIETLNSKNNILKVEEGGSIIEKSLPKVQLDQQIQENVDKNTPGMSACIKSKIKDMLGVFTVPYGIPSLDQFKVPTLADPPELDIKNTFKESFNNVKNTFKDTFKNIKNSFSLKKENSLNQIETGQLSLKKFLGCEETDVTFTKKDKRDILTNPAAVTQVTNTEVEKSKKALADESKTLTEQRVENQPVITPAEKPKPNENISKQEDVATITEPEKIPPLNWNFSKYMVFSTPDSLPLPDTAGTIEDIDATISATDGEKFIADALRRIVEESKRDIKDIIDNKEKNPILANQFYDIKLLEQQEKDFRKLIPDGYLSLLLDINQKSYSLNPANDLGESTISLIITAKYKRPGLKFPVIVYITSDINKIWFGKGYKGADLTFYDYLTNKNSPLYKFIKTTLQFKNV